MILQALYDYYQRKAADPESGIAPMGLELKEIPFLIVIDNKGQFVDLEDTRSPDGKTLRARRYLVPRTRPRSGSKSYETAQLMWDHIGYVLNTPRSDSLKDRQLAENQHEAWRGELSRLPEKLSSLEEIQAIEAFYQHEQERLVPSHALWPECKKIPGCIVTFRVQGNDIPVASNPVVLASTSSDAAADEQGDNAMVARCLVTGDWAPIAKIHNRTPISKDSYALVSFQRSSGYDSFGREQAENAPVSTKAEFAYTTALNLLLGKDSKNKLRLGDAVVVFWSERASALEASFPSFFAFPPRDNPDQDVEAVEALYKGIHTGAKPANSDTRFFVLGLSGNAARIAVRFWHVGTVSQLSGRLRQHFDDLNVIRAPHDTRNYALACLLRECAAQGEMDNIPPNLTGTVVRAILEGTPYPATLLQQAVRRNRAEQKVTRISAGILKACLNRFQRTHPSHEKELTVSLDPENYNVGYRLGRLFATLEKIQEDASPGLNATIRDRFYGAASASPVTAFPQLLKLKNHHLKKIDNPRFVAAHEKRLTEIFSGLPADMPPHLRMEDQARFAVGYYHQRQAFFVKTTPGGSSGEGEEQS